MGEEQLQTQLAAAQKYLDESNFNRAANAAACALEIDCSSYEARVIAGKAAYYLGEYVSAADHFRTAIELNGQVLPAWEGLAFTKIALGEIEKAIETYQKLLSLARHLNDVPKIREFLWRLADAHDREGEPEQSEKFLKELLAMTLTKKQELEALTYLADIQMKVERMRQEQQVQEMINQQENKKPGQLLRSMSSLRLQVDAKRAEEQGAEEGSLGDTLRKIVDLTLPSPRYSRYHEAHLQRYLSQLGAHPPQSLARHEKRVLALQECVDMITTSAGGCTTPFPFEAAIWLLEEQEELYGGNTPVYNTGRALSSMDRIMNLSTRSSVTHPPSRPLSPQASNASSLPVQLNWFRGNSINIRASERQFRNRIAESALMPKRRSFVWSPSQAQLDVGDVVSPAKATPSETVVMRVESFGMKLAHQFPWNPAASVAVGLALRRRFLSDPNMPSTYIRRKQIIKVLKRGVYMGADSAAGWKALTELLYQNRQWQEAYDTAVKGLEWHQKRRAGGHEELASFALALRLFCARCQRRLGQLDQAEVSFKILAGWTTEGECAFSEMSGSMPLSIRQQALRGLAKIALERGDRCMAKAQYERILGKALIGRGPPAEHWAYSEYAWLVFEDGELEEAKRNLEKALEVASSETCVVTESELADHHYKLGRILWTMGGNCREDPHQARKHFEAASVEESDSQAAACAWLGHWYNEVAEDYEKAANCYERALEIAPSDMIVGMPW
eukprot:jgi/Botrbrau1/13374/Bobra.0194s0006.2